MLFEDVKYHIFLKFEGNSNSAGLQLTHSLHSS
jgi:hypothetical protein